MYEIGDIVTLKSGSCLMVVIETHGKLVECEWMLDDKSIYCWTWHEDCLKRPDPPF